MVASFSKMATLHPPGNSQRTGAGMESISLPGSAELQHVSASLMELKRGMTE